MSAHVCAVAESRYLVVNADDYGLTPGVCRAVLEAHHAGVVTSTSALVNAPAFGEHVGELRSSGLPAGLHLCFVGEDAPVLSTAEVPTLVERDGRFPLTWKRFLARATRGMVDPNDLRLEAAAQYDALVSAGIAPTHVDSHQNLHLWPTVAKVATELACRHRIGVVRVAGTRRYGGSALGVRSLGALLRRRLGRAGLVAPDAAMGLDHAGHMTVGRLRDAISTLASTGGHADLTVHPGLEVDSDRSRYAWGYEWGAELDALTRPGFRNWIEMQGFTLASFDDLRSAR